MYIALSENCDDGLTVSQQIYFNVTSAVNKSACKNTSVVLF